MVYLVNDAAYTGIGQSNQLGLLQIYGSIASVIAYEKYF